MGFVAELATKFSFVGSLKPLDNLNAGLTSAVGTITKVTSAFTVAGVALNSFLASTLASADAQVQLSRETGVSMEAIQELGYVASVNGSSIDAMENSLSNLSKKIGEASIQGSADFSRLGISVRDSMGNVKSADTILLELSDRFKQLGLSAQEQKAYLEKFGIDESLLQTLQLGSSEMDNLKNKAKALGIVTEDQANQIADFNDSLTTLKFGLSAIQKNIAIAFAPQLKDLSNNFTDLLVANKGVIKDGLKKFFELVNTGLGAIFKFGGLLYDVIDKTIGWKNALMIVGGAMLYLNRAMWANPIGAVIGLIVGLIAIFDDLDVAMKGGKSLIAEWFKEWFNIDIVALISSWGESLNNFYNKVSNVFHSTIDSIKNGFGSLTEWIKSLVNDIIDFFQPVLDIFHKVENFKMPSLSDLNPFSGDDKKSKNNKDSGGSLLGGVVSLASDVDWGALTDKLEGYYDEAKKMVLGNSSNINNKTQNNNIKIEIKTDNPKLAGQMVNQELQNTLNNANVTFNKGGR